jgi:Tfp pilus assembly protein PilO
VILVAAWFLAINPMLSAAADLRNQTSQVQQRNQVLQTQLTKLKADFAKLPQYKDQLTALRAQIPTDAELSAYLLQIDAIATARSVTVTALAPGAPEAFVGAAPAAAAATAPSPTATPAPAGASGTQAGAAGAVPAGFYDIPISMTVVGSYDASQAFLSDLQNATPRLFLVTSVAGTSQKQASAGGGKPATALGDEQLVVTGMTYVLTSTYPAPAAAPSATPAPVQPAVPGKNPLKPVAGK